MLRERRCHLARGEPAPGPGRSTAHVDLQVVEVANVEDDPAVRRAVSGTAVTAAANRQLEAALAGDREHGSDVSGVGDAGDRRRTAVETAVDDRSRGVIVRVAGHDHGTADAVRSSSTAAAGSMVVWVGTISLL